MDFQKIKEKIKEAVIYCIKFILKYKRYFVAGLIFLCIAILLFVGTDSKKVATSDKATSGVYKELKANKNEELDTLINNYFKAYADGDTDTIQTIATPVSDREISYIKFYSEYIESFNDIQIFTKPGLTDGSYLVSVDVDFKYVNIDTVVPAMDFFYVETNEEGKLFINNLYGKFNQDNNVYEMDTEVSDLIALYIRQKDVIEKATQITEACNKAIESDASLKALYSDTLKSAIVQWNQDYANQVAEEEAAAAKAEEEAAAKAEEEAKKAAEAEEAANAFTGKINSNANVREQADKDSNKLGSVKAGEEITIYGEEGDFYKFDYEGTKAYITKDAVTVKSEGEEETTEEATEETAEETTTASFEAGEKVTLSTTVNIRSKMDTSSSKVAVAYAGEKIEVVMSYAEGWTKVKYKNKEGYIRSDVLK